MSQPLCDDTKKNGEPCTRKAKKGETKCASHLGTAKRPSKLQDHGPRVIEALEIGNSREGAALYAGIGVSTLYHWLELGEADFANDRATEHREFREAAMRAEGLAEQTLVAEIRRAAAGQVVVKTVTNPETGEREQVRVREGADWRAGAFILERRFADRWGKKVDVAHSGHVRTDVPEVPEDDGRLNRVGGILVSIGAVGAEA